MEQHYKSFMEKQYPSDALMKETISKVDVLSNEDMTEKQGNVLDDKKRFGIPKWNRRFAFAAVLVFCLAVGVIWQNTQIQYTDLSEAVSNEDSKNLMKDKGSGDAQNSYLGNEEQTYFIFNKNTEVTEITIGKGKIRQQVGEDVSLGLQTLYQTTPEKVKGHEVYLGKFEVDDIELLVAAFEKNGKHYYLEGEMVTEKEMTVYIKRLLK